MITLYQFIKPKTRLEQDYNMMNETIDSDYAEDEKADLMNIESIPMKRFYDINGKNTYDDIKFLHKCGYHKLITCVTNRQALNEMIYVKYYYPKYVHYYLFTLYITFAGKYVTYLDASKIQCELFKFFPMETRYFSLRRIHTWFKNRTTMFNRNIKTIKKQNNNVSVITNYLVRKHVLYGKKYYDVAKIRYNVKYDDNDCPFKFITKKQMMQFIRNKK